MGNRELLQRMRECAQMFYQNRVQEACAELNNILQPLNQLLQTCAVISADTVDQEMVSIVEQFLTAYQVQDHLALADILYYSIPRKVEGSGL